MIATRRRGGKIDGIAAKASVFSGVAREKAWIFSRAGSVGKKLSIASGFAERTILRVLAHAHTSLAARRRDRHAVGVGNRCSPPTVRRKRSAEDATADQPPGIAAAVSALLLGELGDQGFEPLVDRRRRAYRRRACAGSGRDGDGSWRRAGASCRRLGPSRANGSGCGFDMTRKTPRGCRTDDGKAWLRSRHRVRRRSGLPNGAGCRAEPASQAGTGAARGHVARLMTSRSARSPPCVSLDSLVTVLASSAVTARHRPASRRPSPARSRASTRWATSPGAPRMAGARRPFPGSNRPPRMRRIRAVIRSEENADRPVPSGQSRRLLRHRAAGAPGAPHARARRARIPRDPSK